MSEQKVHVVEGYKEITRDAYNSLSEQYARRFSNLTDLLRRREFARFAELVKGKKVLDIGCGSGDHAAYFSAKGFAVDAIDISEEMVALARGKGIDARVADIESLESEKAY